MKCIQEAWLNGQRPRNIFSGRKTNAGGKHTLAAEACRTLNKICDIFSLPRVCCFDTGDRQAVARFAGETVYAIYNNGISEQRTFDEILNESADRHIVFKEKTADQLFNGED